MGGRAPGPLCSARLGDDWIDAGTTCRSKTNRPGPTEVLAAALVRVLDPAKLRFDADHVYSLAPEAARKRDIDLEIIGDDYSRSAEIDIRSEKYLKELIRLGSDNKQAVSSNTKKMQFFIIRGGAEGFMHASFAKLDAGRIVRPGETTNGKKSSEFKWDMNDLLAVFDPKGKLIRAAFLQRPISISGVWRESTSTDIYNTWHNRTISIYRNTRFTVPYLGLVVDDNMKHRGWVDIHKKEATNGCIFITDPNTPAMGTPELDVFEPKLIVDVLASIGMKPDQVKGMISLGIIKTVEIKP